MPLQFYALLGEGDVELYFLNSLHLFVIWNPFNFQMESLMRVMGGVGAAWDLPVSAVLPVPCLFLGLRRWMGAVVQGRSLVLLLGQRLGLCVGRKRVIQHCSSSNREIKRPSK